MHWARRSVTGTDPAVSGFSSQRAKACRSAPLSPTKQRSRQRSDGSAVGASGRRGPISGIAVISTTAKRPAID
jgi:hypothetical protein